MGVSIFAFANSFYIISKNQIEFDTLPPPLNEAGEVEADYEPQPFPSYSTFPGAIRHVYLLALGEFNLEDYEYGNGGSFVVLWIMFALASFLLLLHLLNMLIAIMGETFAVNNEVKQMQQLKAHLTFVIENWWIDPIEEKNKIKYLICAFLKDEEKLEVEILQELK